MATQKPDQAACGTNEEGDSRFEETDDLGNLMMDQKEIHEQINRERFLANKPWFSTRKPKFFAKKPFLSLL